MSVLRKIESMGLNLPTIPENVNSYTPVIRSGNTVYVSGQIPKRDGVTTFQGRLGSTITVEDAGEGAKLAILNLLAQLERAVGLENITQFLKLQVYVACTEDFGQQPQVANYASDLLIEIFGDAGNHTRTAFGCFALPQGVCVEIDAIVEVSAA